MPRIMQLFAIVVLLVKASLPGGLTNYCPSVLDTVGWVIWPVKIVSDMTYNVFGGTLNPTLLIKASECSLVNYRAVVLGGKGILL